MCRGNQPHQFCQDHDVWNAHRKYNSSQMFVTALGCQDKYHWHSFSLSTLVRHLSLPDEQLNLAGSSQTRCPPMIPPIYLVCVAPAQGEMCCFGTSNHHRDFSGLVILHLGGREMLNLSRGFFCYCNFWFCLGELQGKKKPTQNNLNFL